jgi:hypothetical protein
MDTNFSRRDAAQTIMRAGGRLRAVSTTCAKPGDFAMRRLTPPVPRNVFTLARLDRKIGQPLVSVAQVDEHHFNTMDDYAQFLLGTGDRAFISSRLTRERQDDGLFGWRFGDCHANMAGEVDEPNSQQVHYPNNWSKADRDEKHLILVSNRFLLWSEPVFVASKTQKQSRYGTNIGRANLHDLLRSCST